MRYPTRELVYVVWLTLRSAYQHRSEGRTFSPEFPREEVFARLSGAVARPRAAFGGVEAHPSFFEKVAALGHAISSGHCFGNGNKRTAFVAMMHMLELNGWIAEVPPQVTAFMMLRSASNENRMQVRELADFLAAYSFIPTDDLRVMRHRSDGLVHNGLVQIAGDDPFPVPTPQEDRAIYVERMRAAYERHQELISEREVEELQQIFHWPVELAERLTRWQHVSSYNHDVQRKFIRRTRTKRCGKRRCPHLGGRSVPKICRPITWKKMGIKPARRGVGQGEGDHNS